MKRHFEGRPTTCNRWIGKHSQTPKQRKQKSRQRSLPETDAEVLVLQNDDRSTDYIKKLRPLNRAWAKKHGFNYRFLGSGRWGHLPPWWRKIFLVRDLHASYKTIVYLDSDSCWHDSSKGLEAIAAHHGTSTLHQGLHIGCGSGYFKPIDANAGVFVSHGRKGQQLMTAWSELYTNEIAAGWSASIERAGQQTSWEYASGGWAGPLFEQGAFVKHLLDEADVHVLPMGVFNSKSVGQQSQCLVKHFMGSYKKNIDGYLRNREKGK